MVMTCKPSLFAAHFRLASTYPGRRFLLGARAVFPAAGRRGGSSGFSRCRFRVCCPAADLPCFHWALLENIGKNGEWFAGGGSEHALAILRRRR